jgi:UDP-N-acetylmuramoyl-tripeptide--D-alanyl-D-alanine ligase
MAELGPHAEDEHRRLGKLVAGAGVETLVVVGATALEEAARAAGVDTVVVDGPDAAVAAITPRLQAGDAVLVKASRVAGLERVADALLRWPGPRL